MWIKFVYILVNVLLVFSALELRESDSQYWIENGKLRIQRKLKMQFQTNTAKNLILFLGDGMSLTTITAARIYKGQLQNTSGESGHLSFEKFPFTGISKTYCVNSQVADSACTSTAYLCGVKCNKGTIGVTSKVRLSDCPASMHEDHRPTSIMQWAQWAGKATGIVTTTRVTHASPAGAFAHTAHRDWESDADMKNYADKNNVTTTNCEDIAKQLITNDPGRNFKVIMGGGRDKFMMQSNNSSGNRSDEDLILNWKNDKQKRFNNKTVKYITNRNELINTDMSKVDFVLGLFHGSHMQYRLKSDSEIQPTLQEMTRKAIQLLQKEHNGFVLFVEGGLIDRAHHKKWAKIALDETIEFSKAVAEAVSMTSKEDTLIVVTSDHAHTMSMAGYPKRGENILGTPHTLAQDNITYTTLSYANGQKSPYQNESLGCRRMNVTEEDFGKIDFQYPSLVNLKTETHGGDDVIIFARGPWSHLFTGNMEQNEIPLAMAMAAGISTDPPTSGNTSVGNILFDLRGQIVLMTLMLLGHIKIFRSNLL